MHVLFFSASVSASLRREFADPAVSFVDIIPALPGDPPEPRRSGTTIAIRSLRRELAMSTQNIMWTALPNGLTSAGDKLRLSVLVSPRLITNAAVGTLAEFPDFLDWPAKVAGLTFTVEFQGGPSVAASRVTEPGYPALDSAAWKALFNPTNQTIPVKAYAFDDRSDRAVRSFPTKKVLAFLTSTYQTVAVQSATQMPNLLQLGFSPWAPGFVSLNQIAIDAEEQRTLERQIDVTLERAKAIPSTFGTPQTDFLQVRLMHQPLSRIVSGRKPACETASGATAPGRGLPQRGRRPGAVPEADARAGPCHRSGSSRGGCPCGLERARAPEPRRPAPMIPWTAYTLDIAKKHFVATSNADVGRDQRHAVAVGTGSIRRGRNRHRRRSRKGNGLCLQPGTLGVG